MLERGKESADVFIERANHRGVARLVVQFAARPIAQIVKQIFARLDRGVDGVVRQVEEERFLLVVAHELDGFSREAVGEVLAIGAVCEVGVSVGTVVGGGVSAVVACDVDVEALCAWAGVAVA